MNNKLKTAFLAILGFLFSLTAPFITPIALIFTKRTDTDLHPFFAWYDTPDEKSLIGMYEQQVKWIYENLGWFMAAWHWFGFRNRGHGFMSYISKEGPADGKYGKPDTFFYQYQLWYFKFSFGWQIYKSTKYATGYEYRPRIAIKIRRLED